jgi:hypothetical protein
MERGESMRCRIRRFLPALVLAFAAAGPLAAAGFEIHDIQVTPAAPTFDDSVTITVAGTSDTPCFGVEGVDFAPRDIYVLFSPCSTVPPLQETPVHFSEEIGSLEPGRYRVRVAFGGTVVAEKEFRVGLAPISCIGSSTVCLHANRFQFNVTWAANGEEGVGQAIQLTGDTGAFSFFHPDNIEMLFKVIDGCALNDRYWVFATGLTNVQATLYVSDQVNGNSKTYSSPAGTPFAPIQDTAAFPCD